MENSTLITVSSQIQFVERSRRGISRHNIKTGDLCFHVCYHLRNCHYDPYSPFSLTIYLCQQ